MSQPAIFGVPRSAAEVTPPFGKPNYAARADGSFDALLTYHLGPSEPGYATAEAAGMIWADNAGTPWVYKAFDGTDFINLFRLNGSQNRAEWLRGAPQTMASAATVDLGSYAAEVITITGTTTITSFGSGEAGLMRWMRFTNVLTLTHGANLILPGSANLTTEIGDTMVMICEGGGVWRCYEYHRANGRALFGGLPVGTVLWHSWITAPAGTLPADGSEVSRTTYAAYFALVGTQFGPGNGVDSFNVPDLRGDFIRGWDNGRGVDPGRNFGTSQSDELRAHSHRQQGFLAGTSSSQMAFHAAQGNEVALGNTEATGGAETRPRNVALLPVIIV